MPEVTVVGHRDVVQRLRQQLPPVALLLGPRSIGKRTIAEHLAAHHQVAPADRLTWPEPLNVAAARQAIAFLATRPFGPFKLVLGRLDGASVPALNALLKTLEEPPATARFLLTAAVPTLPTVMSRCHVYRLGLLTVPEVAAVLVARGMEPRAADRAAALARGQVATGMAPQDAGARAAALAVLQAVARRDLAGFTAAFKDFDEDAARLLRQLLVEASTGHWSAFRNEDTAGLYKDQPLLRRMLIALHQHPAARSRLGVRAALEPFVNRT